MPYGTYTYTVTAECYQTISGTVIVDCNADQGVAVVDNPVAIVINTTVTQVSNVLTSSAVGLSYQWVDCNNGNAPILGDTNQIFTATANGSYAVIITDGTCSATSTCFSVTNAGISNYSNTSKISSYPNPVIDFVTVDFIYNTDQSSIQVINLSGQVVYENEFSNTKTVKINLAFLPAGFYFLKAVSKNSSIVASLIKF